ncbi:MAG TPA: PorV/PorQ family protein [bacterium]|nr:PorV/PorQ family protein [bacterium]
MLPRARLAWLAGLAILAVPLLLSATETIYPAAGLAMPLNGRGVGARALALGSAYAGMSDDGTALYWNPGGLGFLDRAELGLHHDLALAGTFQDVALLALPFGGAGTLAAAADYVNDGSFQGYDSGGNPTASYSAGDLGGSLAWGFKATRSLGLGLSARYTQQDLDGTSYQSFAAGLGALWKPLPQFWLGLDADNLGTSLAGGAQPSSLDLGASWHLQLSRENRAVLAAGFQDQLGGTQLVNIGVEDALYSTLALRLGYQADGTNPGLNGLQGVTGGIGLTAAGLSLDYAYLPFGDLGAFQTISLSYRFPAAPGAARERRRGGHEEEPSTADLAAQAKIYRQRVEKDPSDGAAWWSLGNVFFKARQYERANYCFKRAMADQPGNMAMRNWYTGFLAKHPGLK